MLPDVGKRCNTLACVAHSYCVTSLCFGYHPYIESASTLSDNAGYVLYEHSVVIYIMTSRHYIKMEGRISLARTASSEVGEKLSLSTQYLKRPSTGQARSHTHQPPVVTGTLTQCRQAHIYGCEIG